MQCLKHKCEELRYSYYSHGKKKEDRFCREHHNEYLREYKEANKERVLEQHRESRRKIYETWQQKWKDRVGNALRKAIKTGKVVRGSCAECGKESTQAHHMSYVPEKILDITWLCVKHHTEWHRKNEYEFPTEEQVNSYVSDSVKETTTRDNRIIELLESGMRVVRVARSMGISTATVSRIKKLVQSG